MARTVCTSAESASSNGVCRQKALSTVAESIRRLEAKFGSVPLLDAATDLKVKTSSFKKLRMKLEHLDGMISQNPLHEMYGPCTTKLLLFSLSLLLFTAVPCSGFSRHDPLLRIFIAVSSW
jgi:hypothetical protein